MKIYLCNCFLLFFILCVEVSVSIITLPLVINKLLMKVDKLFIENFIMRLINQPLRISSKKETRRLSLPMRSLYCKIAI